MYLMFVNIVKSLVKDVTPAVSDILHRALSSVQNQLRIEPTGLGSSNGRLPGEVTK